MSTQHHDRKTDEQPAKRQAEGQPKAGALPVQEAADKTEDQLEQEALDAGLRHPSRNLDKPEIDKPAYGGGH